MIGTCRKCGYNGEVKGNLCENCHLENDAKRMSSIMGERQKASRTEVEKEIAERKRDKRFWFGSKESKE